MANDMEQKVATKLKAETRKQRASWHFYFQGYYDNEKYKSAFASVMTVKVPKQIVEKLWVSTMKTLNNSNLNVSEWKVAVVPVYF